MSSENPQKIIRRRGETWREGDKMVHQWIDPAGAEDDEFVGGCPTDVRGIGAMEFFEFPIPTATSVEEAFAMFDSAKADFLPVYRKMMGIKDRRTMQPRILAATEETAKRLTDRFTKVHA